MEKNQFHNDSGANLKTEVNQAMYDLIPYSFRVLKKNLSLPVKDVQSCRMQWEKQFGFVVWVAALQLLTLLLNSFPLNSINFLSPFLIQSYSFREGHNLISFAV